ncbi:protein CfxQ [Triangularia verruculosa]|uniref:Protein CfxQ n=1 Tax=Triangularia verruculosa TaxID=2587418 RepID=A0AAN6XW69_9PEZI|nr:protein CfxQ [Triangularia verruculosa]
MPLPNHEDPSQHSSFPSATAREVCLVSMPVRYLLSYVSYRSSTPKVEAEAREIQERDGPVHPRFRHRSHSMPGSSKAIATIAATTLAEDLNGLKSFQHAWDGARASQHTPAESNAGYVEDGVQESLSTQGGFVFPFFHLDPFDFAFREYRFPFFHLDPFDFTFREYRFPFFHMDSSLLKSQDSPLLKFQDSPLLKSLNSPLDKLMNMFGLQDVKKEFIRVRDRVQAAQARKDKVSVRSLKLDLIITGPPGTGKETVAYLYKEYLSFLGVLTERWTDDKVFVMKGYYDNIDPDKIVPNQNIYIVAGSAEKVSPVLMHPNCRGRFYRIIKLKHFSEDELLAALVIRIKEKSLRVKGGFNAPFLRIFARRMCRQRDEQAFRNMWTIRDEVDNVRSRRDERLKKAMLEGDATVRRIPEPSYKLTESDFLGVAPTGFYTRSEAWKKLEGMASMQNVKEAVKELVSRQTINYFREKKRKQPLKTTFNFVFLGPPGTGKTTVATLFGQIIADLGCIESNKVVIKKPTDFLGQYVGHSETRTKEILGKTEGKILIIDEAHMFYHGSGHGTDESDIFRKGIVDTIVAHIDNEPGNNRCIILMGYPDRMKEFYRNTNPGFQRRFPLEDAFVFHDYDDEALGKILDSMMDKDGIAATDRAKDAAMAVLRKERDRPNFGNGGAVRNLLSRAQVLYSKRMQPSTERNQQAQGNHDVTPTTSEGKENDIILQPEDFDPEYDRGLQANKDCSSLFSGLVGFQTIIASFKEYQTIAANMGRRGLDPRDEIPFSFIFKGPPGSGKTTTARALGQIYYDMGLLSTTEVIDCSVTDLVGEGPGLTGPKVQNLLLKSLGKVLFIDEAYRMGQKDLAGIFISRYAQEAVGELVDCMTKERFAHKLVIVLAGYDKDMNRLMSTNQGLRSRFTEMAFPNLKPKHCLRLLREELLKKNINILHSSTSKVLKLFEELSETAAWANARDVKTLSKRVTRRVFMREMRDDEPLEVGLDEIAAVLEQFLNERRPGDNEDEGSDT